MLTVEGHALSGGSGYAQGGIYFPVSVAADSNGTVWVVNYGNPSVVQLNSSGKPLSGSSGIVSPLIGAPVGIALNSKHEALVGNQAHGSVTKISADGSSLASIACCNEPVGIAVDQNDNVWIANQQSASVAQINAGGQVVSFGYTAGGLYNPAGVAIDGSGNVWVSNNHGNSITELAGAQSSSPGKGLSPQAGYGVDAGLSAMYGIAVDASGNVWVNNSGADALTDFIGIAAPVKTPLVGVVTMP